MQTFLPFKSFKASLSCLDYRRLGKQRVEAYQILNALTGRSTQGWRNHPITKMWSGYENALKEYMNFAIIEWMSRGYKNTMKLEYIKGKIDYPAWLGHEKFHSSHRSNLLRKDWDFYAEYGWIDSPVNPYVWFDPDILRWYAYSPEDMVRNYL